MALSIAPLKSFCIISIVYASRWQIAERTDAVIGSWRYKVADKVAHRNISYIFARCSVLFSSQKLCVVVLHDGLLALELAAVNKVYVV